MITHRFFNRVADLETWVNTRCRDLTEYFIQITQTDVGFFVLYDKDLEI